VAAVVRGVKWWRKIFLFGVPLGIVVLGVFLWWPPDHKPNRLSDLGSTVVGGGIVAFVVFSLDQMLARRQERNLTRQQLAQPAPLEGIDLSKQDLSGLFLGHKNLKSANLSKADLRGANLGQTDFTWANLDGADLRGAYLDGGMSSPNKPPGGARGGSAHLHNTSMEGALYDSSTRWPPDVNPKERGAINLDEQRLWRRFWQSVRHGIHEGSK
jgi:Pentapeptide repeats (8 copies)